MKRRYRLLKDSPELRAGAILEEQCEAGNQGFYLVTPDAQVTDDQGNTRYARKVVMEQPEWFEEIGIVNVAMRHLRRVQDFIAGL